MPSTHPGAQLRGVLFDLDGTLVDTADDFVPAVQSLQREYGVAELPAARIRSSVSNGARALVRLSLGMEEQDADFEHWRQRLLTLYGEILGHHARLYPGLDELLDELQTRAIAWGIVTNKPRSFTVPLLESLDLNPQSVVCPQDVEHPKPHPESLYKACSELACAPASSIYLGDHSRDVAAGRAAGMHTVACAYGYIEPGDNAGSWGADAVLQDSKAMAAYLLDPFNEPGQDVDHE